MMRYGFQIQSKTYELIFTALVLLSALLFSENEVFWGKKTWRNSYLFYLTEFCVLGIWLWAFVLQLRHLFKKYEEILRRKNNVEDDSIQTYGISSGLQSADGIMTLHETPVQKKLANGDREHTITASNIKDKDMFPEDQGRGSNNSS